VLMASNADGEIEVLKSGVMRTVLNHKFGVRETGLMINKTNEHRTMA
jgi:hypothetical protein